jgi:hypothetical protein
MKKAISRRHLLGTVWKKDMPSATWSITCPCRLEMPRLTLHCADLLQENDDDNGGKDRMALAISFVDARAHSSHCCLFADDNKQR